MMRANPLTYKAMTEEQYAEWLFMHSFNQTMMSVSAIMDDLAHSFRATAMGVAEAFKDVGVQMAHMMDQIDPHRVVRKEALEAGEHPALIEGWL